MKNRGFTIIELLVATVVFSLVLLLATSGILYIARIYNRGVNQSRLQDVSRAIADEITESIRYTNAAVNLADLSNSINDGDDDIYINYFCIGAKRYTYAVDKKLESDSPDISKRETKHVLWVDQADCSSGAADLNLDQPSPNGRELLSENMRINKLEIIDYSPDVPNTYGINLSVGYGDDETQNEGPLILNATGDDRTCKGFGSGFGGEFCAVSTLSITAERRL